MQIGRTLYKLDSKGKIRIWSIYVEGVENSLSAEIVIEAGLKDGKKVKNNILITEGKNLGKANATTPFTQALAEAKAKLELQLRSGYVEDERDVKQFTLGSGIPAPMLAQKYHPTGAQSGSKTIDKMKIRGQQIHVQPKYDGNRCLIKVEPSGIVTMYTRKGDVMIQLPHITDEISARYKELGLTEELVLDGELFSDEISFSTLNGLLRKEDKTPERQAQAETIHYRVYDMYHYMAFYQERYNALGRIVKGMKHVRLTPSYKIIATDENIDEKLNEFLAEGHEGLMIRRLDMSYENKRSWQLVKCKIFEDKEFELVDIEEDARGGFVGAFIMKMDIPSTGRDGKPIEVFRAGISGLSQEEGAEMLLNKQNYLGKVATVEFFGRSEYNVPRFPKLKGFRND